MRRCADMQDSGSLNYLYWLFQTIAMTITGWVVPGFRVVNVLGAILMVVALAFVNTHIWDAALFFSVPNSLTYRTLVLLVSNGVIFWILVKLLPWIEIRGCLAPLAAPVIFTLLSVGIGYLGENVDWEKTWNTVFRYVQGVRGSLLEKEASSGAHSTVIIDLKTSCG